MIILRDAESIAQLEDPELRALIEQRVHALAESCPEYQLSELARFVVVEPGDPLEAVNAELGFPLLSNRWDGTRFGQPGFTPSFELVEEHGGYYELVFVLSDDGYGIELFVPKHPGVPAQLLAMCQAYAVPAEDS